MIPHRSHDTVKSWSKLSLYIISHTYVEIIFRLISSSLENSDGNKGKTVGALFFSYSYGKYIAFDTECLNIWSM